MVIAVLSYNLTMHYPRLEIFDSYDKTVVTVDGSYEIAKLVTFCNSLTSWNLL